MKTLQYLAAKISAPLLTITLLVTGGLLLSPSPTHAQGGVPLWTNFYNGPANFDDGSGAIAVDKAGNVFVTGGSWNNSYTLPYDADYATVAYSNSGQPLWTSRYNGADDLTVTHDHIATAVATDDSGKVFVTGWVRSGSDYYYATLAYSSAGVALWTNRYAGGQASALAVDPTGNVLVTGSAATIKYSGEGIPLWTNTTPGGPIATDSDGNLFVIGWDSTLNSNFTIKYSSAGLPLWTNLNSGTQLAVDTSGNVFVAGSLPLGTFGAATVAYSNAGVPLWTNRSNVSLPYIAVDSAGNVFVTGSSFLTGIPGYDITTIKYSAAGAVLWTRRYNGPGNSDDNPYAIAVDSVGNVFVTGDVYDSVAGHIATILAYSNTGAPLWTNRFKGTLGKMAVDCSGNVFVTGSAYNGSNSDYVTIKYSSSVPPPRLDFQNLNGHLVLSWTNAGFTLQSAPAVTGPFTNVTGASSPYTNPISAPQQFFRLAQ